MAWRRFTRPYSARSQIILVVAIAVGTLLVNLSLLLDELATVDMRDLVRALKAQLPFWSLPLGWLAASATAPHAPTSMIVGPVPGRNRSEIIIRQMLTLAGVVGLGTLFGVLPATVKLMLTQHWTWADVFSLLAAVVSMVSLIPIGAAAAALVGWRVGVVVAPVAIVAATLVPAFVINDVLLANRPASIMSLAPVWSLSVPGRGSMLVWQVELLRICYFALLWLCMSKVTTALAEWRASHQKLGLPIVGWLALPVIVMAVVALQQPILSVEDPGDQVRCDSRHGLEVCLYQVDEVHRSLVHDAYRPLVELIAADGESVMVTQDQEAQVPHRDTLVLGRLGHDPFRWLPLELSSSVFTITTDACEPEATTSTELANAVAHQLLRRASNNASSPQLMQAFESPMDDVTSFMNPAADTQLQALPDEAFAAWFSKNREAVASCTLKEADLP